MQPYEAALDLELLQDFQGDAVIGHRLRHALTRVALLDIGEVHAVKPIIYLGFPDDLLAENAFLGRLAALIDDGRLAGNADIGALRQEFGGLTRFEEWLSGPGRPLMQHALRTGETSVSLR